MNHLRDRKSATSIFRLLLTLTILRQLHELGLW